MIYSLISGMKNCVIKPINYENVTQEKKENPALFQGRPTEAFRKYTNTNPPCLRDKSYSVNIILVNLPQITGESHKDFNFALGPQWLRYWKSSSASIIDHDQTEQDEGPSVRPDRLRTGSTGSSCWHLAASRSPKGNTGMPGKGTSLVPQRGLL